MQLNFSKLHQLTYTLSLLETPYKSYLKSVSTWDTTFSEEEEMLGDLVKSIPDLKALHEVALGNKVPSRALSERLKHDYLLHIPTNYGTTYPYLDSLLFFTMGYNLKTHESLFDRIDLYVKDFRTVPFFLDTLVEKEYIDSLLNDNQLSLVKTLSVLLTNNDVKGFLRVLRFLNSLLLHKNVYSNTHYESKRTTGSLIETYKPEEILGCLNTLYIKIREEFGNETVDKVSGKILNSDLLHLEELIARHDFNKFTIGLFDGDLQHTRTLLEFILIISSIPSYE